MMAQTESAPLKNIKRKRPVDDQSGNEHERPRQTRKSAKSDNPEVAIGRPEDRILESREHYNGIVDLLARFEDGFAPASLSLCRVFCKLIAINEIGSRTLKSGKDLIISNWLLEKLDRFEVLLLQTLQKPSTSKQSAALTILMQLVQAKAEGLGLVTAINELFTKILGKLVFEEGCAPARNLFASKYLSTYFDVQHHTAAFLCAVQKSKNIDTWLVASMLLEIPILSDSPERGSRINMFSSSRPMKGKSISRFRSNVQDAWMQALGQSLDKRQRKTILEAMITNIVPWFSKAEQLMDFLTDSFNSGGSISLLALSGLFHLIASRNLDYPSFYVKLYSLVDADILHSKHRSRFLRQLDTFLASTHLPAVLVASFIKRLSRLCLNAPPAATVAIVPWIYNLLKIHPTCTFMLHKDALKRSYESFAWGDPFNMQESDPMRTGAIESSLWELHTLQTHYHPNVAAVARVISEQFTKRAYNIEDFLDHSYGTMIEMELGKSLKKDPEVEYMIPKRILTISEVGSELQDGLMTRLWDFS